MVKGVKVVKRIIVALIVLMTAVSLVTFAQAIELTEEYIVEHGIPSVDEYGNATILIPLYTIQPSAATQAENVEHHCLTNADLVQRHFSLTGHTHRMLNIRVTRTFKSIPISDYWADEGFTITWTKGWSKEVHFNLNLASGISKNEVETTVGMEIGGSKTYTETATYTSPQIPAGYEGRISLRVNFLYYVFDDEITYYLFGVPTSTEMFYNDTAESQPLDAVVYLELRPK